ncbi:MAG: tRNA (guanosine(37)-N1)-methyltransferase TrmD [Puniceicoccales bacterium]|jgi:tRNA (guanine37-N1)-methyltransferase|nr:tRNA (guanosine(37)-N1)-methyltransferase TrmD [Puniceicoccales bacterium]
MEDSGEVRLRVDVLSLFPRMMDSFVAESMLARAICRGLLGFSSRSIREWATDKHATTDDRPFGGGAGMVLKPEPICRAIDELRRENSRVIYLCPDGMPLRADLVKQLAQERHLILLCGHYEGIDERVRERSVDLEISIGDYILTNGVLAAAVLLDAVVRHVPGVLGAEQSLLQDSFNGNLLTYPQYTRPEVFEGRRVPEILLNGDHKKIDDWRKQQQIERTRRRREDLFGKYENERENSKGIGGLHQGGAAEQF